MWHANSDVLVADELGVISTSAVPQTQPEQAQPGDRDLVDRPSMEELQCDQRRGTRLQDTLPEDGGQASQPETLAHPQQDSDLWHNCKLNFVCGPDAEQVHSNKQDRVADDGLQSVPSGQNLTRLVKSSSSAQLCNAQVTHSQHSAVLLPCDCQSGPQLGIIATASTLHADHGVGPPLSCGPPALAQQGTTAIMSNEASAAQVTGHVTQQLSGTHCMLEMHQLCLGLSYGLSTKQHCVFVYICTTPWQAAVHQHYLCYCCPHRPLCNTTLCEEHLHHFSQRCFSTLPYSKIYPPCPCSSACGAVRCTAACCAAANRCTEICRREHAATAAV